MRILPAGRGGSVNWPSATRGGIYVKFHKYNELHMAALAATFKYHIAGW
jgi:hypothetical protein